MTETQQQLLEQEQPDNQSKASAKNLSEVPTLPQYDPEQLQRSFGIVNQESDHFKRECVMHQQAQEMGMTIEEYRHWYELRSQHPEWFHRATQALVGIWRWTGFREKKLWDVLQLLIVPAFLAGGAFYLQESAKQKDQQLAGDSRKQESLNKYFDTITTLLFDRQLRNSKPDAEVRTIARAKTLTILQELASKPASDDNSKLEIDDIRKGLVLHFLQETKLIEKNNTIVSLKGADFTGANLYMADLHELNLSGALFLNDSYLDTVNLSGTDLSNARFVKSDLRWANLSAANLSNAHFRFSDIHNADFNGANLSETRFRDSNLRGAYLIPTQLDQAKFCNTILPDGKISNRDCNEIVPKE